MANDLMRTGPRGSANQGAWLVPMEKAFANDASGAPFIKAAGGAETGTNYVLWGAEWRVAAVRIIIGVATAGVSGVINVGTSATSDAYVDDYIIPAGSAANSVIDVPLNGTDTDALASEARRLIVTNAGGAAGAGTFNVGLLVYPVSGGKFYTE